MKAAFCGSVAIAAATAMILPAVAADSTEWKTRCKRELGRSNDPETGKYYFSTPGMAEGALGRAKMDYSVTGSRESPVYLTAEKDFISQWNGATLNVGYVADFAAKAPHAATLRVGHIGAVVSGRDRKVLSGAVKVKLLIDGKAFGPYDPKADSLSSGMYAIWLDTVETDGDSKPPVLKPADFAKLGKAFASAKTAEMVLLRDKVDLVRMPVPIKLRDQWTSGFQEWATSARGFVKKNGGCPSAMDTNW